VPIARAAGVALVAGSLLLLIDLVAGSLVELPAVAPAAVMFALVVLAAGEAALAARPPAGLDGRLVRAGEAVAAAGFLLIAVAPTQTEWAALSSLLLGALLLLIGLFAQATPMFRGGQDHRWRGALMLAGVGLMALGTVASVVILVPAGAVAILASLAWLGATLVRAG